MMTMMQFNNIQDPIARAEAMRAQAIAQLTVDAIEGLRGLVKGAAARLKAYARYRRNYNTLSQMTDRELDDIGISRADIPAVARGIDPRPRREAAADAAARRLALAEAFKAGAPTGEPANEDRRREPAAAA